MTTIATGSAAVAGPGPPPSLDWQPCGVEVECATLEVPLDYDDPDGPTIELALDRRRARGPARALGTIVVNPGGPGASGLGLGDYVQSQLLDTGSVGEAVAAQYDIVGFDPRGVGASEPVVCASDAALDAFYALDATPDGRAERRDLLDANRRFAGRCARRNADLLPHVGTADVARDLDRIRDAVGDERLNYLGWSYGTEIGTAYAHQFPERVGRVVLDGAVAPDIDIIEFARQQAKALDESFTRLVERCAGDAGCTREAGGDLGATFDELLARLDREPLRVGDRGLTASQAVSGVAQALFDAEGGKLLARAIGAAHEGRGRQLLDLFDLYAERDERGEFENFSSAVVAINCLDYQWPGGPAAYDALVTRIRRESPRLGQAFLWEFLPCGFWSVPPNPPPDVAESPPAGPILVVGTTGDPSTPYAGAEALAAGLPGAVLLTRDGEGHTAYLSGDACVDDAVSAYFLTGATPAPGTICRG